MAHLARPFRLPLLLFSKNMRGRAKYPLHFTLPWMTEWKLPGLPTGVCQRCLRVGPGPEMSRRDPWGRCSGCRNGTGVERVLINCQICRHPLRCQLRKGGGLLVCSNCPEIVRSLRSGLTPEPNTLRSPKQGSLGQEGGDMWTFDFGSQELSSPDSPESPETDHLGLHATDKVLKRDSSTR